MAGVFSMPMMPPSGSKPAPDPMHSSRATCLRPVTHRHWITRLIQNLLQSYTASGRYVDVAAMLELELLLWPDQCHLQRDLGLVLARLGQQRQAAGWLSRYLDQRPDDPQRSDLEELLGVLG